MGIFGPQLHTILVLLYINSIKISSLFVETCWYMVYISFGEFMGCYLCNIAFWVILGAQNGDPYDFSIVLYKQYQKILIICKNMVIYGLHQFWGVAGPLFVKYCILRYLEAQYEDFCALVSYHFDIVVYKQYQKILIICTNMLIYGLHQFCVVSAPLFVNNCIFDRFLKLGVIFYLQ